MTSQSRSRRQSRWTNHPHPTNISTHTAHTSHTLHGHTTPPTLTTLPTITPTTTGLRPNTTLRHPTTTTTTTTTHTLHDEDISIRSSVTTPSTTSRARSTRSSNIAPTLVQDTYSARSSTTTSSSRLPGMMIPRFPLDNFESYIQWLSDYFGNRKMFLSLDYHTLHTWFREYLRVSSLEEAHDLPLVPPQAILSAFESSQVPNYQADLIELMIIFQFIAHQLSLQIAFPWSLESYFAFRMNQYPCTASDYTVPIHPSHMPTSPPPYTPHSPHVLPMSHPSPMTVHRHSHSRTPTRYHPTPPTIISHHEDSSIYSSQQRGYYNPPPPRSVTTYGERTAGHMGRSSDSVISETSRSLKDEAVSQRRRRNEEYARLYAQPKIRSNIASDKLQWDGHRSTFLSFANDLEGNMIRIGLGYLFEHQVQHDYETLGLDIAHKDEFWHTYRISYQQLKQDSEYLYGLLKSATKTKTNPFIMRHKNTRDGLSVWIAFQKTYVYGGSEKIRSNELEELMLQPFNPRAYKGVSHYIDEFQSWVEELDGLGTRSYRDDDKKRMLLRNLLRVPNITHLLQSCEDRVFCNFEETCNYIRSNSMVMDKMIATTPRPASMTMLNTTLDSPPEPSHEDIINKIQMMMQETSPVQVYQALRSPTMRDSLSIPTALWKELEPSLRERIMEIRESIRKKKDRGVREQDKKVKPRQYPLPPQYANKTSMDLVANLCSQMNLHDSDEDTDDDMMIQGFCTTTIEYRAHLEYANSYSSSSKIYAISDGGADACVVGTNAYIAGETGRYAHLVGYDPATTKSHKIPIVTAYLKVMAHNGIPVLLKIHEAAYNAGSPITLLSEYQVREHGYIVDSVATKHKASLDTYGSQRIILNDVVHVPFEDRGGLMGFEILPIEDGDIDEVDPKYDIFELTSSQKWIPARFRANTATVEEEPIVDNPMEDPIDNLLDDLAYDDLVQPSLSTEDHEWLTFGTPRSIYNSTIKPWHRVLHDGLDPASLQRYLAWRPLEIVKKTLEHTTQLATSSIRYPMRRHFKSRNPFANVHRLEETVSTDPIFANCKSIDNHYIGAQIYYGLKSKHIDVYGIKSKGEFPRTYKDFIREQGAPSSLRRDNAKEEKSFEVMDIQRQFAIKDQWSEAYHQHQNPVEGCAIKWLKSASHSLLDRTGAPATAWYFAVKYLADVHNVTFDPALGMTPSQKRHGVLPDISAYLQHAFWDPILYLDHEETWPNTKERPGRWLGIAHNIGDCLTYWVLDDQTKRVLARSVIRPFSHNRRVKWDPLLAPTDKYTAQSESIPSAELRQSKLDSSMDKYDELECLPAPQPGSSHPCTRGSIIKGRFIDDPGPGHLTPVVPLDDPDPYQGESQLRYDNAPQDMDVDIVTPSPQAKKSLNEVRYSTDFVPSEAPSSPLVQQPQATRRSKRIAERQKEKRIANRTSWVPSRIEKLYNLTTNVIGILFLPTHVQAVPSTGMIDYGSTNFLFPIDDLTLPLKSSPSLEKLRAYHAVLDRWNKHLDPMPEDERWRIDSIVRSSNKVRLDGTPSIFFKVRFADGPKMWLTMDQLRVEDPYLLIDHTLKNNYLDQPGYEWVQHYVNQDDEVRTILKASVATGLRTDKKYKFGVEVPRNPKHALELDKQNGNDGWAKSIQLELDQIMGYKVFKILQPGEPLPKGYTRIPYHIVHDVKFDGRLKSRLVAGGHRAPIVEKEDRFSGVVSMEAVRIGFCLAKLNNLQVCAGDVGNAFLYGTTQEKVYIVAGPEFGPKLAGKRLLIEKSLYGLASSAARYHEHCSAQLTKLGFKPTKADSDLWYKQHELGHYEYIARYVDDIMVFAKDPMAIMKELEKVYVLKGVGSPRYYLGGDVLDLDEQWEKEGITHALSAQTYIQNCVPKIAKMIGIEQFAKKKTPFDDKYHPELDDSPLCPPEKISQYRSMIGSANWILTLGRFDIAYTLSTLSRYSMAPREGHFQAMIRLFGYLMTYNKGMLVIDSAIPSIR